MRERSRITSWLYPPVLLCATACGVVFVLQDPAELAVWALAWLAGAVVLWILISTLFPAASKKICPRCGAPALQRVNASTLRGVKCGNCDHEDADESAFLLAEEEPYAESGSSSSERRDASTARCDASTARRTMAGKS